MRFLVILFSVLFVIGCRNRNASNLNESAGKPIPDENNVIDVYALGDGTSDDEVRRGECDYQLRRSQPFSNTTKRVA